MKKLHAMLLAVLVPALLGAPCALAGAPDEVTLHVTEVGSGYRLSVPVSDLVITFPKGGLVRQQKAGGAMDSPRYFFFEDKQQGLIVSGWFESSQDYASFDRYWAEEKQAWKKKNIPLPQNEARFKSGRWVGVTYDIAFPPKMGHNSHIRAHWVQANTWIDLHMSMTGEADNAKLRKQLAAFLKSMQITQAK